MVNSASKFPGPLGLEIAIVHALVAVEAPKVDRSVFVLQEKEEVSCVRDCESAFLYHKSEMELTSKCLQIRLKPLKNQKMCLKNFGLRPDFGRK